MREMNGWWHPKISDARVRTCSQLVLMLCLFLSGCGDSKQKPQGLSVVDRVRSEVASILGKKADEIDISKPLVAQGADELDIVEIVMAVEEAFKVEIPDNVIGEKIGEVSKTLTVEKLAEVVSKQKRTRG